MASIHPTAVEHHATSVMKESAMRELIRAAA
jgi:hypothetical protein